MSNQDNFIAGQRTAQAAYFAKSVSPDFVRTEAAYRLKAEQRPANLAPSIRESAQAYFGLPRNIAWHRHADHGLSSQVCCLNFLMPLATQPKLLGEIIGGALGLSAVKMLPITDDHASDWYVGFEWIGGHDYLGEWPKKGSPTRGANVTSADAVVRFEHNGRIEAVLIEWKYTETYGARLKPKGNPTRIQRYSGKTFAPDGPIRGDLGLKLEDFFWEPFYQLLRQQMLAWRMERMRELDADRVSVLHIAPAGNTALHRVTAPRLREFGESDAFRLFPKLLVRPDDFRSRTIEEVFGTFLASDHDHPGSQDWARYLSDRYNFALSLPKPMSP